MRVAVEGSVLLLLLGVSLPAADTGPVRYVGKTKYLNNSRAVVILVAACRLEADDGKCCARNALKARPPPIESPIIQDGARCWRLPATSRIGQC